MQNSEAVMVLLDIAPGVSRVHASRKFFELLRFFDIDLPVIHTLRFPAGVHQSRCIDPPLWSFATGG